VWLVVLVTNGKAVRSGVRINFEVLAAPPPLPPTFPSPSLLQAVSLLTPTIVALCGNSSVHDGKLAKYVSTREGIASEIDPRFTRHGMADGPFYSILDYIGYLSKMPMLLRPRTTREMVRVCLCVCVCA
jgi:hypothetical protein